MKLPAYIIVLFLLCCTCSATTYYVATDGNDASAGGLATPFQTMHKAAQVMTAGDVLYIRGGFYNCTNNAVAWQFDPTANSLTVSNYPGEQPVFGNFQPDLTIPELIGIYSLTNIKIFGLTITNTSRSCYLITSTNCEIAYCTIANSPTNLGYPLIYIHDNSPSNWVHHCTLHGVAVTPPTVDSGEVLWIGGHPDYVDDFSYANRIENNHAWSGGHSIIEIRAPLTIVRSNNFHNEPWIYWADYQQYGGQREISLEPAATNCVIEWNRAAYAGQAIANASANGIEISSRNNIVRNNLVLWNQNNGLLSYTKLPAPWVAGTNYIYNNTFAWNGLGQLWVTNYTGPTYAYKDKYVFRAINADADVFKNNLLAYNTAASVSDPPPFTATFTSNGITWGGGTPTILNNWTNDVNGDPLFVNIVATNQVLSGGVTVLGDPFDTTTLNLNLKASSPCVDAGAFLTTITSANGSGTTLTVADGNYFFDGYGVTLGDEIELQGSGGTARITAANRVTGEITVGSTLTWTNGQGVALAYNGAAPDAGAHEYEPAAPATGLVIQNLHVNQLLIRGTP